MKRSFRVSVCLLAGFALAITAVVLPGSTVKVDGDSRGYGGFQRALASEIDYSPFKDNYVLGLFSENVRDNLKNKYPSSEWPWVRNVRITVPWDSVEGEGKGIFDWTELDSQVNAILSLGIDSILLTIFSPCPRWAAVGANVKGPPADKNDLGDFCKAVAERYKGYVDYYQIYQEPGWDLDSWPAVHDGVCYFYGYCDFDYMGMLRAGYNGVKEADPNAYVISGSMLDGLSGQTSDFKNYELLLAGSNQDLSMKVEADKNIVAERPMYFDYHRQIAGGTDETGIPQPDTLWYLAEGCTHGNFQEWITLQNPGNSRAEVTITYMFGDGSTQVQRRSLKAHSRATIDVNSVVGPNKDVSARVVSTRPIVVERPMYFNYLGMWPGGSIESGVKSASDTWYLAEGTTRLGFEEWISFMNPGNNYTDVAVTYMFKDGTTQEQTFQMKPTSRKTVMVNEVVGMDKDVSARVVASNPIIVERPMYFWYKSLWPGGHSQIGATESAKSWFLSEGTTRGNANDGYFDEYISIMNPGDEDANVTVTYMFPGGETQEDIEVVGAHSRGTIYVNEKVGIDRDVSVQLDSDVDIVVERPMYFWYHNQWPGGTVELGCRNAKKTFYFAEGTTRANDSDGYFQEWLTLQNPQDTETNVTLTFMFNDATTQEKEVVLPPNSRTTVGVNNSVSIGTICDGVGLHPYYYLGEWDWYYSYLKGLCCNHGYPDLGVDVTEIGWPHSGRGGYSPEEQRQAIGERGVGELFAAGCKKIWIYEDVDPAPGTSWDDVYCGLFDYYGNAMPAWYEYKNWQSTFCPDYPNKPDHLW